MKVKNISVVNTKISLVIPCFNEEEVLVEFYSRAYKVFHDKDYSYEFIFIDDGSKDSTSSILRQLCKENTNCKALILSRNFGHQNAVSAGLAFSEGDAVVIIDADLQDPPELIPQMINLWVDGNEVVYGQRIKRKGETFFKKITAKYFYILLNKLSDVFIPKDTGDFRLIDRKVIEVFNEMPEKEKFIRGIISWIGFNQIAFQYERDERYAGESKYPLKKMITFALNGILSFSSKPLKISYYLGLFASILSMVGIFYVLYLRIFTSIWLEGWTTTIIAILFLGGTQLISLGILGEYISRLFTQSKNRPTYIIKEGLNINE